MEKTDFNYVLELFETAGADPEGDGDAWEADDNLIRLRERAEIIWKGGRFKIMVLWEWGAEEYKALQTWKAS